MADEFAERLEYISTQLNRYFAILIFVFGTVGSILNCLVLSQRSLRFNPCAVFFLISSFVELISILVGLTPRILAGWDLDPTTTINWACKLRTFVTFSTRTMAIWLIMFATVDRWLSSSMDFRRRQMSSLKNVKSGVFVSVAFAVLSFVHMLDCYEANRVDGPLKCYGKTATCRLATDIIYAMITIVLPSALMVWFGILIVSNVHHIRVRIQTVTITSLVIPPRTKELKLRKTDHQLLRMLLVQVLLLIIFCIPQAIQKFYITFRPYATISSREDAINHFLYNIEVLLAFIASGMPFYLYTLAGGTVFRKASMDLMKTFYRLTKCWK